MKQFGAALIGVFSLVGVVGAVEGWVDAEGVIDEVVAESGTTAPRSFLRPLAAEIPFQTFRYPAVDGQENVTFIADDPVYSDGAKHHGIYRSMAANGKLEALVRAEETGVPARRSKFVYIRGLQTEGERTERFVFNARDSAGRWGFYLWDDQTLRTVVRTGETVLPGQSMPATDVKYGNLVGRFALVQARTGDAMMLGLFDSESGDLREVIRADGKTAIPGRKGEFFRYLSPQNWISDRDLVFRAARVADPYAAANQDGADRGIYGWFDVDLADEKAFSLRKLRTVADWKTEVPGLPGRRFSDLDSAPVGAGLVAFAGGGDGFRGIYVYDGRKEGAELRAVVDTESGIQGLFEGPFTGFCKYPNVADRRATFVGRAGKFVGIFCYDVDRDTLYLLADNRSELEGRRIVDFEISSRLLRGDRLAVMAQFADGGSGVYLATIPDAGFQRAGGE